MGNVLSPYARQAVLALDGFGCATTGEAVALLRLWPNYDKLTPDDLALIEVLYLSADFEGEWDYQRDEEPTEHIPLPRDVEGFNPGGRSGSRY